MSQGLMCRVLPHLVAALWGLVLWQCHTSLNPKPWSWSQANCYQGLKDRASKNPSFLLHTFDEMEEKAGFSFGKES